MAAEREKEVTDSALPLGLDKMKEGARPKTTLAFQPGWLVDMPLMEATIRGPQPGHLARGELLVKPAINLVAGLRLPAVSPAPVPLRRRQ